MVNQMYRILAIAGVTVMVVSCTLAPTTPVNLLSPEGGGFVPEVDEPSTRGLLSRRTPPNMHVRWGYAISRDGQSLVFSGKQAGSTEPYQLYRLDGSSMAPVKITSGGDRDAWDPSFTGDGQHIVYRSSGSFWKIRKDGSGARVKIPGSGLNRDHSPEVSSSDRVVFTTYDRGSGKYVIWTSGLDGSELTQYREGNHPSWSPDGLKIAFDYEGDIWVMNSDGTELTQLTSTDEVSELLPSFSPDGQYVVYSSDESRSDASADANIWYIRVGGGQKTQVTSLDSWDSWPVWSEEGIHFQSGREKGDKDIVRIWRVKPQ